MVIHPRTLAPAVLVSLVVAGSARGAAAEPRLAAPARTARVHAAGTRSSGPRRCAEAPVEVTAGREAATFVLSKCDGSLAPLAVEHVSVLARPPSVPKPKQSIESLARSRGVELAPGVRRMDAGVVQRLARFVDRFRKPGETTRVVLVSGYRGPDDGSYHARGRALDFRIRGVEGTALAAFCRTLADTGCGEYPNAPFVHVDARDPGTGHVAWTDVSGPGQAAHFVLAAPAAPADPRLPPLPDRSDVNADQKPIDDRLHSI